MSSTGFEYESMMSNIEQRFGSRELVERVAREHPVELVTEVLQAAMRHGVITSQQALEMIRDTRLDLRRTLSLLSTMGHQHGWDPEAIVLEALHGHPH